MAPLDDDDPKLDRLHSYLQKMIAITRAEKNWKELSRYEGVNILVEDARALTPGAVLDEGRVIWVGNRILLDVGGKFCYTPLVRGVAENAQERYINRHTLADESEAREKALRERFPRGAVKGSTVWHPKVGMARVVGGEHGTVRLSNARHPEIVWTYLHECRNERPQSASWEIAQSSASQYASSM